MEGILVIKRHDQVAPAIRAQGCFLNDTSLKLVSFNRTIFFRNSQTANSCTSKAFLPPECSVKVRVLLICAKCFAKGNNLGVEATMQIGED